jgi:hypothetical protein
MNLATALAHRAVLSIVAVLVTWAIGATVTDAQTTCGREKAEAKTATYQSGRGLMRAVAERAAGMANDRGHALLA